MSAICKSVLSKVCSDTVGPNILGRSEPSNDLPTNAVETIASPQTAAAVSLAQAISDELGAAIDRLENISASSFNVAGLAFIVGECNSPQLAASLLAIEPFIGMLEPGTSSTRRFISAVHALQALSHDIQELLVDAKTAEGDLTLRCENVLSCVDLELERLLFATWEAQQLQVSRLHACDTLGAHRFDFRKHHYLAD